MKKGILVCVILLAFLVGCKKKENSFSEPEIDCDIPVLNRVISIINPEEGFNPYIMEWGKHGFLYYVQDYEDEGKTAEEKDSVSTYSVYYCSYDKQIENKKICSFDNGLIRAFSFVEKDGKENIDIFLLEEAAHILEYDLDGNQIRDVVLENLFNNIDFFPVMLPLEDDSFVVAIEEELYLVNSQGKVDRVTKVDGTVSKLLNAGNGVIYAVFCDENGEYMLGKLNSSSGLTISCRALPSNVGLVSVLDDGSLATFSDRYLYFINMSENEDEKVADLLKQDILYSLIRSISGSKEKIIVAGMDLAVPDDGIYIFSLSDKEAVSDNSTDIVFSNKGETEENPDFFDDGRPIVHVAVPESCSVDVQYHAGKYNQKSQKCYIKIDEFEGSVEDYLGKGARPDAFFLQDQTEIMPLVERGIIESLSPLLEERTDFDISGMIPNAVNVLGDEKNLYALASTYELILRASDGTEYAEKEKLSTVDYLKWVKKYSEEHEISCKDIANLEAVFLASIADCCDIENGTVSFDSQYFREVLEAYRDVKNSKIGVAGSLTMDEYGVVVSSVGRGINMTPYVGISSFLGYPNCKYLGLPAKDGKEKVYMQLDNPLVISASSEKKREALDFMIYFEQIDEYLNKGGDPYALGKTYNTYGRFSVFEDKLKQNIFETEQPFAAEKDNQNSSGSLKFFYFSEENKENIRTLIDSAEPITKWQMDIFDILTEDLEGYVLGDIALEDYVRVLQSRASIYMSERK